MENGKLKQTDKLEFAGLRPVLFDIICANGATVPRAHQVTDKLEFAGLRPVLFDIICANGIILPRALKVTDKLEF